MTRVHVVSDVHGAADALARAGDGADVLVCLGDLILFVDYEDPSQGILADLFGAERAAHFIALRTADRFEEARAYSAELWREVPGDRWEVIRDRVDAQYEALFAALPSPAYLTYGNVDIPALWPRHLRPGHTVLDGEVVEIDGVSAGFVGGGLTSPMRTPFEVSEEEFAAKVDRIRGCDVVFSHIPPAVPELCYDVAARRFERGSRALLDLVRTTSPRLLVHGHVHQPLVARTRIHRTECVNVGHFRARRRPYVLAW